MSFAGPMLSCPRTKNRGVTLIGVVVATAMMSVLMMAFISMFKSQFTATRRIAALGGVSDLSNALDTLFGSPGCAVTGVLAAALPTGPVNAYSNGGIAGSVTGTATNYSLSLDTLRFASGVVAITSRADNAIASMIQPYTIASITFVALGGVGVLRFPFLMRVTFASPNNTPPPQPLNKFVTIYGTGASFPHRVVGACSGGGGGIPYAVTGFAGGGWSAVSSFRLPYASTLVTVSGWASANCNTGGNGSLTAGIYGRLSIDGVTCTVGNSWSTNVMQAGFTIPLSCSRVISGTPGSNHTVTVAGSPYGDGTPSCTRTGVNSRVDYTAFGVSTN